MTGAWNLAGLLGRPGEELLDLLGPPDVERRIGDDVWMRFSAEQVTLRVRCDAGSGGDDPTVASWTATFAAGRPTLRAAAVALGLWPAAAPDCRPTPGTRLIRRRLDDPSGGATHSLTATVRKGAIVQMTAFDEPPDWL